MTSETDAEFVERIESRWMIAAPGEDFARLFALARRGAEMQWRPIEEEYEGEVLLWPRNSELPSHFLPLPPPPKGDSDEG